MHGHRLMLAFGILTTLTGSTGAATNAWSGAADSDWSNGANWSLGTSPAAGESVLVANAAVAPVLSVDSPWLASFTIEGQTLTFSNWTARLRATNVVIRNQGVLTHHPNSATAANESGAWIPDARVHVACSNLLIEAGGKINADLRGYGANAGPGIGGYGTVGRATGGAGHGGAGGSGGYSISTGGATYGSADEPSEPGSGGRNPAYPASGGGVVRIEAGGDLSIHGSITANGGAPTGSRGSGGSGGSVSINCRTFSGSSSGLVAVRGGNWGGYGGSAHLGSGAGGGGRIAVHYESSGGWPGVRFDCMPGYGFADYANTDDRWSFRAGYGTLYLPDAVWLGPVVDGNRFTGCNLMLAGLASLALDRLAVSNSSFGLMEAHVRVVATNGVVIGENGALHLGPHAILDCRSDLVVTNGGALHVYAGPTNGIAPAHGAIIGVTGTVRIGQNSWIYPYCDPTNGAAVAWDTGAIVIAAGGGINANARGFAPNYGPGRGLATGEGAPGAAHGGQGGRGASTVAPPLPCGSLSKPVFAGSGGGQHGGYPGSGRGGGVIWLAGLRSLDLDGSLLADGGNVEMERTAGGAGGTIRVSAATLNTGPDALLSAAGGTVRANSSNNRGGGGGGGGRISLDYETLGGSRTAKFATSGGRGWVTEYYPDLWRYEASDGTVFLPDAELLSEVIDNQRFTGVNLHVAGRTTFVFDTLTVSNASFVLADEGIHLIVRGKTSIGRGGRLGIGPHGTFTCAGAIEFLDGGAFAAYGGPTNAGAWDR